VCHVFIGFSSSLVENLKLIRLRPDMETLTDTEKQERNNNKNNNNILLTAKGVHTTIHRFNARNN
jgi:hypothetical protein